MKRALVTGASGFVGAHLVNRLKKEGYWVRAASRSNPVFAPSLADEYLLLDLSVPDQCKKALSLSDGSFDEAYQLSADMGGIGFISAAPYEVMRNNALINIQMIQAAVDARVRKYFFSSSACIYRDMRPGEKELTEDDAMPAEPDNEYGWEKLYSERLLTVCGAKYGIDLRIGRFQTTYGPQGTWRGGREKAPAAICRKVSMAVDGGEVEVWGDGSAVRSYLYIDDLIAAVQSLMHSEIVQPVNIGSAEYVSVKKLTESIIAVSGKRLIIKYVPGPVGVLSRNFSNERIYSTGWRPKVSLDDGIKRTYNWILQQVQQAGLVV